MSVIRDLLNPDDTPEGKIRKADKLANDMAEALKGAAMPDLKSVVCAFAKRCGGADGIAKMLMREYRDAKPGTMIRAMVLQMILQGFKSLSAKEAPRDASLISDEDLNRELTLVLSKLPRHDPGETASGQTQEAPATPAG